jgi:DNA-binding IclR family transcriptional regulator
MLLLSFWGLCYNYPQSKPLVRNMKQNTSQIYPLRPQSQSNRSAVQSVWRALDLLEVFPRHGPELGLTQIASLLNLNKATAYRLLATLEERGYIERAFGSRKYRLGVRAFELGLYFQSQLEVRRLALPSMQDMVAQTGEAAFLCMREGDEAVCIERVEAEHQVNIFSLRVGGRQPLHCGAAPRALLSGMDENWITLYAARTGLPASTPDTLTTLEGLLSDAEQTRARGYVVSMNDVVTGIAAVGAPLLDHSGNVAASISLSGLSIRYDTQRIDRLASIVVVTAKRISRQLGYLESA